MAGPLNHPCPGMALDPLPEAPNPPRHHGIDGYVRFPPLLLLAQVLAPVPVSRLHLHWPIILFILLLKLQPICISLGMCSLLGLADRSSAVKLHTWHTISLVEDFFISSGRPASN